MESLMLPQRENYSLNEKINCQSPISSFGNDFNILMQSVIQGDLGSIYQTQLVMTQMDGNEIDNNTVDNMESGNQDDNHDLKEEVIGLNAVIEVKGSQTHSSEEKQETGQETSSLFDVDQASDSISINVLTYSTTTVKRRKNDISLEMEKYSVKVKTKKNKRSQKMRTDKLNIKSDENKVWKSMPVSQMEFMKVSLFPRPTKDNVEIDEDYYKRYYEMEAEIEDMEKSIAPYEHVIEFEGKVTKDKYLRSDRDRKVRKAHRQVKNKHCKNIKNNLARIQLYIHHRVYKMINLEIRTCSYLPTVCQERITIQRANYLKTNTPNSKRFISAGQSYKKRPQAPQNLAYAIDNNNAPTDIDLQLVNLLIALQTRDVTPEDYDMLLQLDESIAPKTLSENILDSFKTDTVDSSVEKECCTVCMEHYNIGDIRKFLPCGHVFHTNCIDMWLKNSSMNCPIDNLPVDNR